jgi:uncharacterized damage-inducible protein DinB
MTAELDHYRQALERIHTETAEVLEGLPPAALNWRPLPQGSGDESTNTLAMTVTHMAGSERFWVGEVVGERPAHRDREAEFRVSAASTAELTALLDQALAVTRETLSSLPPAKLDETVTIRERTLTRRWAVLHAVEHLAVHLGHLQLTRQLWQAQDGA